MNRLRGGRLLVVGGHSGEVSQCQAIYSGAGAAGIGECQLAMPDTLRSLMTPTGLGLFVPSSPSGSIGRAAAGELLHAAADYDAVLIGANLTNNSETAAVVESLLRKLEVPIVLAGEACESSPGSAPLIAGNQNALVICSMEQLIKIATALDHQLAGKANSLVGRAAMVGSLTQKFPAAFAAIGPEILIGVGEEVTATDLPQPLNADNGAVIGILAAMWLQQRHKPLEALTTGAFLVSQALLRIGAPTPSAIAGEAKRVLGQYL